MWKNSSKINVLVSNSELFCYTEFVCLSTILSGFSWLLYHPQWNRLDWVSEQHWWSRRHPVPSKRRRHEGCTASLAQIWGHYYITTFICVETFRTSLNPPVKSKTVVIVSAMALRCVAMFCDRARLQPSLVRAALKPSSVPSQRTCPHRLSACGSRQFLFPLWGECYHKDR